MSSRFLFVGTYTRAAPYLAQATGHGIHTLLIDEDTGALRELCVLEGVENPSFIRVSPSGDILHAVWEVLAWPTGLVSSYRVDATTGALSFLGLQSSRGRLACYVTVDAGHEIAYVANYLSGTVAAFPTDESGALREAVATAQHLGMGPDPERQEGPHPHSAVLGPAEADLFVADLGIDAIIGYPADLSGLNHPHSRCELPPGFGPRHLVFHPSGRHAYVVGEMANAVATLAYDIAAGSLSVLTVHSTLPTDWTGDSHAADIHVHPSGKWVYASNRGHNSIAVFAVRPGEETLAPVGHCDTRGATPRNFKLTENGRFLVVANQDSDSVQVIEIDQQTGMPHRVVSALQINTPAFVALGGLMAT